MSWRSIAEDYFARKGISLSAAGAHSGDSVEEQISDLDGAIAALDQQATEHAAGAETELLEAQTDAKPET